MAHVRLTRVNETTMAVMHCVHTVSAITHVIPSSLANARGSQVRENVQFDCFLFDCKVCIKRLIVGSRCLSKYNPALNINEYRLLKQNS